MIKVSSDLSKAPFGPATRLLVLLDDRDDLAPEAEAIFAARVSGEQPDAFGLDVNSVGGTLPRACQHLNLDCHVGSARHSTMPRPGQLAPSLNSLRSPMPKEIQLQSSAFTCRRQGTRSVSRTVLPESTVSRVSVAKGEDASRCMTCSAAV